VKQPQRPQTGERGCTGLQEKAERLAKTGADGAVLTNGDIMDAKFTLKKGLKVRQHARGWRAAERHHPTHHTRIGSHALQTLGDPILLLPWLSETRTRS
jgi:hypothetical protein